MKKISILLVLLMSVNALAECKWSSIERQGDKFVYSADCHKVVGKLIEEAELREEQVKKLNESIKLSDLAIQKAEDRVKVWRDTSYSLEDRIRKQDKYSEYKNMAWFGSGILATVLAGWALGQSAR